MHRPKLKPGDWVFEPDTQSVYIVEAIEYTKQFVGGNCYRLQYPDTSGIANARTSCRHLEKTCRVIDRKQSELIKALYGRKV